MDAGQLAHRFAYHPPSDPSIAAKHEDIRTACGVLAQYLNETIDKECREKSLAITALEEAMFWANAAVARELNYRGDSPATPPVHPHDPIGKAWAANPDANPLRSV
jgi:hypothetical protein